jgi:hypothetical protein
MAKHDLRESWFFLVGRPQLSTLHFDWYTFIRLKQYLIYSHTFTTEQMTVCHKIVGVYLYNNFCIWGIM